MSFLHGLAARGIAPMTSAVHVRRMLGLPILALVVSGILIAGYARGGDGGAAPASKVLTVCALPASMPRTGKAPDGTPQGLDVAVITRVGRILDRTIEFHWCASAQCSWHCLPEGRCELVIGQPCDSGPPREVAWSVPYAGAQFGLVVPRESQGVVSLADLRGKRVGIVAGTVAVSEQDHTVARFPSREELLDKFQAAGLDAAFLDADFAAWHLHEHPRLGLRLLADHVPRERWNMAFAVRAKDTQLLVEINRAIAQLGESGELKRIYEHAGVPYRRPFSGTNPQQASPDNWRRIRERGELRVSMDPANLPYTSARDAHPGFDVELARALAERLHLKLQIEWLDVQHETVIGELLQHECDLVFGEAVAANLVADDQELTGKVLYSRPYYGTGYVLVERKNGPHVRSLAELKGSKSERLGAEAGSVADYSLRQRGYLRRLYRNQLATLKALNDGDIDYAYLWANVGWTLHVTPEWNLELARTGVPEDHWNIAVAMNRGDDELKRQVDAALAALIADGTVVRTLARYHVPHFAPFSDPVPHAQGSRGESIRHGVVNRGPEPQMQKVQKSRQAYSGLARVRSAGELVVGLDQNNLPYSTAHPEPAGFDYEIAGMLANELGLRLRVYWAYSSHDSYPSKLTSRGLCDVILGVMPDDRFEHRVLYSRPYYLARYQLVVRAGEGRPAPKEPLALEQGVAVRGLEGRTVRPFPSTEAILEAVAEKRVAAGYVISPRAPWLAWQHWRGQLTFLSGDDTVGCFPISAAVRKNEPDLKDAIDQAWNALDRSGRLAEVFARWHIPYETIASADRRNEPVR
jgi:polar amino acid transport system substrate-binding protein